MGMQGQPLLVTSLIDHAAREHAGREIVSRWVDGSTTRSNWGEVGKDARRFAAAMVKLGITKGDRIATLAMNHGHHLVSWYGTAGMGGVLHTVNPRLFDEQLVYIINHAEDRVLLFDAMFLPIVERLRSQLPTVEHFILFDAPAREGYLSYRDLIDVEDGNFEWVELDERDPVGLCYTSGTTGNPKGVLYEHRSNVIHAITEIQPDVFDMSNRSVVLPIVPMFHANSWGIPFAAATVGAKLVFSATNDARILCDLMHDEGVTHSAGVPTVWLAMFAHMDATGMDYGKLYRVIIGGSAAPRAMIERFMKAGIDVGHAWGMTETSPIGTMGKRPWNWDEMGFDERVDIVTRQGCPPFGVELRVVDDEGGELPRDGETSEAAIVDYLKDKVAKWWLPDEIVFVDELPHTATGKILKRQIRDDYKDYKLRSLTAA